MPSIVNQDWITLLDTWIFPQGLECFDDCFSRRGAVAQISDVVGRDLEVTSKERSYLISISYSAFEWCEIRIGIDADDDCVELRVGGADCAGGTRLDQRCLRRKQRSLWNGDDSGSCSIDGTWLAFLTC
jgi:hypothetical protein